MKTLKLIVIAMMLFLASTVHAQVSVNVNITPPPWGPVGYTDMRYYYIPDVESYYDVQSSMFIYYTGGAWVHRTYLPTRYRNYDLYNGYKVVLNGYRGETPYTNFTEHRKQYAKGFRGQHQKTYGERPGRGNTGVNKHSEGRSPKNVNHGNGNNNVKQGNNKGDAHGNNKNSKNNQGNGGGKGKNK